MTSDWQWNDESIPAEEVLYRHIPAQDASYVDVDSVTGRQQLNRKAFKTDDFPDGWSIFRRQLLLGARLSVVHIRRSGGDGNTETREVWEATVGEVRAKGLGVTNAPDPTLGDLGDAHGVIRLPGSNPTPKEVRAARGHLLGLFRPTQD